MNKLNKNIAISTAVLGAITIAIGAFGAHGLKQLVSADSVASFETGVRYQMYHIIVLLAMALSSKISDVTLKWVFRFFVIGMILFCGSIYVLALKEVLSFSVSFLGPITPIGGLLFILGWLRLAYGFRTLKS